MNISGSKESKQRQLVSPTMAMDLVSGTNTDPFVSLTSAPSTKSTTQLPISIPPLQDLNTDGGNDEFQTLAPNFATLVYVEDEIANGSLSPPKLRRI